jgi:membrane-associated phospholipid phosphatase
MGPDPRTPPGHGEEPDGERRTGGQPAEDAAASRGARHPAGLDHPLDAPRRRPLHSGTVVAGLVLGAAAALAAALLGIGPAVVDHRVLGDAIAARSDPLTWLAIAVTNVGSTTSMGVLSALVALWLLRASRPHDAVFVGATAAGASLLFTATKRLLDRARPPLDGHLVDVTNESLPSGHATMSVAVIGSLIVLAWPGRATAARVTMTVAGLAWVGAVGLTRIYLGVHWFSDVVAGWLLGGAWLALCVVVADRLARSPAYPLADRRPPSPDA